jgi:hypothetical protein
MEQVEAVVPVSPTGVLETGEHALGWLPSVEGEATHLPKRRRVLFLTLGLVVAEAGIETQITGHQDRVDQV